MHRCFTTCISILIASLAFAQQNSRLEAKRLADKGDYQKAIAMADQIILTNPRSAILYIDKANFQVAAGSYELALKTLNTAIRQMPDTAAFYEMRGTLLEQGYDSHAPAIQDFTVGYDKAKDNPTRSRMLSNRGGCKVKTRDFNGAYEDMKKAVVLDSSNMDALNNVAAVCIELNKSTEALKYLNQVIKVNPRHAPAYVNIGFRYQGLGQHERAIGFFNKAIELEANEPYAYSNRSFSKLKLNDLEGALKDIEKSITIESANSYAYKIKALIEIEKKMTREACNDLHKAAAMGYAQRYGSEVNELIGKNCK